MLLAGCSLPVMPKHAAPPHPPDALVQEVFVRIDSDAPGAALVRTGEQDGVECVAPCLRNVVIRQSTFYELHAPGQLPTSPFSAYSAEDKALWLTHEGVAPSLKWGFGAATVVSGTLGLVLLVTGGAMNTQAVRRDTPDLPLGLGVSGLILGLPICALFGGLTAAYSDSRYDFKDPALPGFRF